MLGVKTILLLNFVRTAALQKQIFSEGLRLSEQIRRIPIVKYFQGQVEEASYVRMNAFDLYKV